jgi:uncharacterized protein YjdB
MPRSMIPLLPASLPGWLALIVLGIALDVAACGGSSTSSSTVSAIAISPSPCAVGRTDSVQMTATATLPDGTKENVTSSAGVTWTTGNSNTATADPTGVVVGVNAGVTAITAEYQDATGSINCTVGP